MGYIALNGIKVFGRIGVTAEERKLGRNFIVDVKIKYPLNKAGFSDSIDDSFDYCLIAEIVDKQLSREFNLLESTCRAIAADILEAHSDLEQFIIRIQKLAPFVTGIVDSSEIEWHYPEDWQG